MFKHILVLVGLLVLFTQASVAAPCKKFAVVWREWDGPESRPYGTHLTSRQLKWWNSKGHKQFTNLCMTDHPDQADWWLAWSFRWSTEAFQITAPKEIKATTEGQIWTAKGGNGEYSSTTTIRDTETKTGTTNVMHVLMLADRIIREGDQLRWRPEYKTELALDPSCPSGRFAQAMDAFARGAAAGAGQSAPVRTGPFCGYADQVAFEQLLASIGSAPDNLPPEPLVAPAPVQRCKATPLQQLTRRVTETPTQIKNLRM